MSENSSEREAERLKNERLEKEAKSLKEHAEKEQRQKDQEAEEEEARKRRAAAAAAERARQAAAAAQQKNKPQPKPKPQSQEIPSIVFSPDLSNLRPPAPGARPRPEPDFIKKFRESLEEDKKQSVHYNPDRDQLIFVGNNGLDALSRFLEQNPSVTFTLNVEKGMLQQALRDLNNQKAGNGTLLDKLSRIEKIEIDGSVSIIQGDKMRGFVSNLIGGAPRLSPPNGSSEMK